MPPRDTQSGPNTLDPDILTIPCHVAQGPGDPGSEAWKLDHPDWFEAGTWTPSAPVAAGDERRQRRQDAMRTVGQSKDVAPLDPATISLADFKNLSTRTKQGGAVAPVIYQPSKRGEFDDIDPLSNDAQEPDPSVRRDQDRPIPDAPA